VRRLALSLALIAARAALFAAAGRTGGSVKDGGTFRFGTTGASVQIDPQLAYVTTAWWLEYATAAKLFNYPDRTGQAGARLVPEVASRFTVSRDGRTWTFTIRRGFRFSDGSRVTPFNFKYAIERAVNYRLSSPAAQLITDPNGANIVGARAVNERRAKHVRGVSVRKNRLVIHLTRPDGAFLTKLAMPFFQATSKTLPLTREVLTAYPSAGPYFVSLHQPDVATELRRNPYYRGKRPRNLRGVDVRWSLNEQRAFDDLMADRLDRGRCR
jgi:peptide/nickel transport system substrate-binding protein